MPFGFNDVHRGVRVIDQSHNKVNIVYSGLLSDTGADRIYLHWGYGDPKHWHHINTEEMERTDKGFSKIIELSHQQLNFCFKDPANNWDNNKGRNWNIR